MLNAAQPDPSRHPRLGSGRRFRHDTERLEKLFEFSTKMAAAKLAGKKAGGG
jgi:hypothetical protein